MTRTTTLEPRRLFQQISKPSDILVSAGDSRNNNSWTCNNKTRESLATIGRGRRESGQDWQLRKGPWREAVAHARATSGAPSSGLPTLVESPHPTQTWPLVVVPVPHVQLVPCQWHLLSQALPINRPQHTKSVVHRSHLSQFPPKLPHETGRDTRAPMPTGKPSAVANGRCCPNVHTQ